MAKGRFQWPATTRGSTASVPCPRNPDGVATRFCALDASRRIAIWDEPDVTACTMVGRITYSRCSLNIPCAVYRSVKQAVGRNSLQLISHITRLVGCEHQYAQTAADVHIT